ncbi:hypothetical protein [Microbacterium sp.]|uniref:hypothetical protein n=1 Tax=Microbacterium sp. TaxID=51671 RepID=UPI003A8C5FBF
MRVEPVSRYASGETASSTSRSPSASAPDAPAANVPARDTRAPDTSIPEEKFTAAGKAIAGAGSNAAERGRQPTAMSGWSLKAAPTGRSART